MPAARWRTISSMPLLGSDFSGTIIERSCAPRLVSTARERPDWSVIRSSAAAWTGAAAGTGATGQRRRLARLARDNRRSWNGGSGAGSGNRLGSHGWGWLRRLRLGRGEEGVPDGDDGQRQHEGK